MHERLTTDVKWDLRASRSTASECRLVGHAAVFDSRSHDLGGFTETIAPGAFRNALADPSCDVQLLVNHEGLPIARQSAGTLKLSEDATGLKVEANLVPTAQARDVHTLVQTGHLRQMSFAFFVGADDWSQRSGDGSPLRRVTEVKQLLDVSVVGEPAYPATAVAARSGRVHVTAERPVYGEGSDHSYFRDLVRVSEANERRKAARLDPVLRGRDPGEPGGHASRRGAGSLEEARKRLASVEERTLSTANSPTLIPQNVPDSVAAEFGTAARAVAVMPEVLGAEPVPEETGMTVKAPKFTKGGATGVDAENEAITDTDPEAARVSTPIAYVSGQVELSRQLLDRGRPDNAIARDLGEDLATKVEAQILNGSGEGDQALGLLNVSGITSTAWTAASPTGSELVKKIGANYSAVATALGYAPDTTLATPSRRAWLLASEDENKQPLTPRLPASLREVPGLALGLGEGKDEDVILTIATPEIDLYLNAPTIMVPVADYAGSDHLTVKVVAWTSLAVLVVRQQGVGKITGTGLVTPSFA